MWYAINNRTDSNYFTNNQCETIKIDTTVME